jgi:hypothetical protein
VATVVQLGDGRIVAYNDYYGSCSGCDSWEGASDADVRAMCIGLANDAQIFETLADCIAWLGERGKDDDAEHYDWHRPAPQLHALLMAAQPPIGPIE